MGDPGKPMKSRRAAVSILLLMCSVAHAEGGHPLPMWRIDGGRNTVFLLGSIHMLREQDYPLPSAIYDAYREAETLVMEIDMDDMDPIADQALATELGLIQDDRVLEDLMGPVAYDKAESMAETLQIPLQLLDKAEPWFAAINVEVMMLMRIGFNPMHGVESHFSEMAMRDNKEIIGLETTREQLQFLDTLSPASQRDMLLETLADSMRISELMDQMVDAWYHGDVAFLEDNLLAEMQEYDELHDAIVVKRNRNWTKKIEALLTDKDDYLIVVGAMHLVGKEGVPNLLSRRGHDVTQMYQPGNE